MLQAENLNKVYKFKVKKNFWSKPQINYVNAVSNISMNIEEGKIIGLLGMNGAGKTTTIKMLSSMLSPTSGKITIDGIDAIDNPHKVKKIVNLITGGERNIYWRLTAKENLEYFGSLYGIPHKELKEQICRCLELVDLADSADIPVEKYSKGMKQRLQIARGLINNPKYLFLDEPTLGLDVVIAKELRKYIIELARKENKGILLTTHYLFEADELCDYIYIIDQGKITAEGTTAEIKKKYSPIVNAIFKFDNLSDAFILQIKRESDVLKVIQKENELQILSKKDVTHFILDLANKNQIKFNTITLVEPSLEDSLISLISEGGAYNG